MHLGDEFKKFEEFEEESLQFKRRLRERLDIEYLSFYERLQRYLGLDYITFACFYGLSLFLIHLAAALIEENSTSFSIVHDFSYFLAIMNAIGLFLLLTATDKLREFIVNLISITNNRDVDIVDKYLGVLEQRFLGTRTFYFGMLFGIINCSIALVLGVNYLSNEQYWLLASFLFQVFAIGFIGGITVNQTTIIVGMIKNISFKEDFHLRYFYPDRCAGTLIIGNILLIFSLHFIAIGIFIFFFLQLFDWTFLHTDPINPYTRALHVFWRIFPFLMAGIIFFLPAKRISKILMEYKLFEQLKIKRKLDHIRQKVIQKSDEGVKVKDEIEVLDTHYQKLLKIEEELEKLNNWPYNLRYRTTFLSIFLPVLIGAVLEISEELISKFLTLLLH